MTGPLRSSRRLLAPMVAALCCGTAQVAQASPLFELLGGVGNRAGFNGRGTGPSPASAYFNPALLPKAAPEFETGVMLLNDAIELSLDGRGPVDISVDYRGATHADGTVFDRPSLPTSWLRNGCVPPECDMQLPARPRQAEGSSGDTRAYAVLGLATQLIGPQLVLGLYGLVPLAEFTSGHSFFTDEREQFFTNSLHPELYADRLTATSLAMGLGSQLLPRLSIGISFTVGLHNTAASSSFVGNADDLRNSLVVSNDVSVETEFAPHFGITYDPVDRVQLSATAHSVQQFELITTIGTLLPNGNLQRATRHQVHDYQPWRFAVGASIDLLEAAEADAGAPLDAHALSLCVTGVYGLWSTYLDRQGERPRGAYAWDDTLSVAFGARHSYGPLRSFLDLQYAPTPVPRQTGRSNYVDNDRIATSFGADYEFELFETVWRVGLQAQAHALLRRHQKKIDPLSAEAAGKDPEQLVRDEFADDAIDERGQPIPSAAGLQTNNPGWPGFASSGLLTGAGATLAILF